MSHAKFLNGKTGAALLGVLALGACTVPPPAGPTILATPPEGKATAQFQNEDLNCRAFAQNNAGTPAQAAQTSGVASAAAGTALGAAGGALIGSAGGNMGAGAAVGAGIGLLTGALIGGNTANASARNAQQGYDQAYAQCMTAAGNQVHAPPPPQVVYAPPPAVVYAPPPPVYYAPPPAVVVTPGYYYRPYGYYRRW